MNLRSLPFGDCLEVFLGLTGIVFRPFANALYFANSSNPPTPWACLDHALMLLQQL
jgi:hypothetical protein